jgi:N-glycosylase/DNA lyase
LAPGGRLDLGRCIASGQVFRWETVEDGWFGLDGGHWYRVWELEPATAFRVRSNVGRAEFERLFRLDWDADAVEREIVRRGPELAPYLSGLRGLRVMRPSDPVEVLFSFLCTSNNHIARITKMVRALAAGGAPIGMMEGAARHRFPEVETIAWLREEDLREAGFGYRARTIPLAARRIVERGGRAWLRRLQGQPYEAVREALLEIEGVGPKLADCIALFGLDKTEAAPIDTHIWQAATRLYFPEWRGAPLTMARYRIASEHVRARFGEFAGWAQQYLFYENVLNWRSRRSGDAGVPTVFRSPE